MNPLELNPMEWQLIMKAVERAIFNLTEYKTEAEHFSPEMQNALMEYTLLKGKLDAHFSIVN